MNIIEILRVPYENDPHKCKKNGSSNNKWFDKFNIKYKFYNNVLIVDNIKNVRSLLLHFSFIPFNLKIVFKINDFDTLTNIVRELNINNTDKDIILDLSNYKDNNNDNLEFSFLPDNVKISFCGYKKDKEKNNIENDKLVEWFLWLDDFQLYNINNRLDFNTKENLFKLKKCIFDFYTENSDFLDNSSILSKCNFIYDYINNNADKLALGLSNDNKAKIFKAFLNNRYINVNCHIVNTKLDGVNHNINIVYDEKNKPYCYDLDNNLKQYDGSLLGLFYSDLDFSDVKSKNTRRFKCKQL